MKTIFITKLIKKQEELDSETKIVNGKVTPDKRIEIYNKFNSGDYLNFSITESIVLLGGVRYKKNGEDIKVVFLDDITDDKKKYILSRMNIN